MHVRVEGGKLLSTPAADMCFWAYYRLQRLNTTCSKQAVTLIILTEPAHLYHAFGSLIFYILARYPVSAY